VNRISFSVMAVLAAAACVPAGNAPPYDAGAAPAPTSTFRPSVNVLGSVFEDDFERPDAASGIWDFDGASPDTEATPAPRVAVPTMLRGRDAAGRETGGDGAADSASLLAALLDGGKALDHAKAQNARRDDSLGPNWRPANTNAWKIEEGRLCAQSARNHGVWLTRALPINARIEFDAIAMTDDGDLKAEFWGDGQSSAKGVSYSDATSYITVLGGWKNKAHVLARMDEHGKDRKEITVDPTSDDEQRRPVARGQTYRFRVERTDGKTVRWSVNDKEYLSYIDAKPLVGFGHDHFGFNEWDAKTCFDNVKVTPL
jgi:hypothetical protein